MSKQLHHILCLAVCFPFLLWGQNSNIFFIDKTNLLENEDVHSGVAMGIADMNNDHKDDIIRFDQGRIMMIEYQQSPDEVFGTHVHGSVDGSSEWSMCVADADENGYNDVLVGGFGHVKIARANASGTSYALSTLTNSNIFLQGSNFVDINNDGALDIYACHDNGLSRAYENNGNGQFTFNNGLISTTSTPTSDDSGNYASIWTDYDNDGDLDLYLSKCRQGVNSFTDLRRINMLWENDGNNQFTEVAAEAGLQIGAQTWATDFADIDNDGDMDCFVLNHSSPSQLFENNGNGIFTEITESSGMSPHLNFFGIQAIFRDFNNDGWVDLLVSGNQHRLFINDGNGLFVKQPNPFSGDDMQSFAIGDLNSDGFLDIYSGYANFFTSPSGIRDRLFMNSGNDNHYLKVQLEGVISNKNAIGAWLELHGSWGIQTREVRSGEGYGIMNSFQQHFGLGAATQIEKLVIRWPAGGTTEILTPEIDQLLVVSEDGNNNELFTQEIDFVPIDDRFTTAASFEVFAFASSSLPVSLSIVEGPATIFGHTITLTGEVGTVTVQASQSGNTQYHPATTIQRQFEVTEEEIELLMQSIELAAIDDRFTTAAPFEVFAFSTSGLPVELTILVGPATISGNIITLTGEEGIVVVEASQVGDEQYAQAINVHQEFVVRSENDGEEVCENVTDAGIIFGDEWDCEPYVSSPMTNDLLPSGGNGTLELIWQQSTISATSGWVNRPETSAGISVGWMGETTWFRRGARRAACEAYLFSNVLVKEVLEDCNNNPDNGPDTYCETTAEQVDYEWIESISLGNMTNDSGENDGYGDYRHLTISLNLGGNYTITLEPGFGGQVYNEVWQVWIDFNQDEIFDETDELVLTTSGTSTLQSEISIPTTALSGTTRMRVAMRWNVTPEPCGTFVYGEVEDYTVQLVGNLANTNPANLENFQHQKEDIFLYPNPVQHDLYLDVRHFLGQKLSYTIHNPQGQVLKKGEIEEVKTKSIRLNVGDLATGLYYIKVKGEQELKTVLPFVRTD